MRVVRSVLTAMLASVHTSALATLGVATALGLAGCSAAAPTPPASAQTPPAPAERVVVEQSSTARTVIVNATAESTFVGHFVAGTRVRISVIDTQWTNTPSDKLYDAAGVPGLPCRSKISHPCLVPGAPLMGLILETVTADVAEHFTGRTNVGSLARPLAWRKYIPEGAELVLKRDSDVYLAPNDWDDSLSDNSGSARVEVRTFAQ